MIFLGKNMFSKIRFFNNSFNKTNINMDRMSEKELSHLIKPRLKTGDLVYHKLGYYSQNGTRMKIAEINGSIAKVSIEFLSLDGYSDPLFEEYETDELDKL